MCDQGRIKILWCPKYLTSLGAPSGMGSGRVVVAPPQYGDLAAPRQFVKNQR